MACNKRGSHERFVAYQDQRQMDRLWKRALNRISPSQTQLQNVDGQQKEHANQPAPQPQEEREFPSEAIQKKLLKGKSTPRIKSPLQKFDEIVTRELTNRKMMEENGISSLEDPRKWSTLQFSMSDFGRGKLSPDKKISRGVLYTMEKETLGHSSSDPSHCALLEAVDKLVQAQAFCRFEAAVKAAEAATASVPPEQAEEVAVACAKDYQFEIVDVINEKIPLLEERKPIEVIGYIGMTKLKENLE